MPEACKSRASRQIAQLASRLPRLFLRVATTAFGCAPAHHDDGIKAVHCDLRDAAFGLTCRLFQMYSPPLRSEIENHFQFGKKKRGGKASRLRKLAVANDTEVERTTHSCIGFLHSSWAQY